MSPLLFPNINSCSIVARLCSNSWLQKICTDLKLCLPVSFLSSQPVSRHLHVNSTLIHPRKGKKNPTETTRSWARNVLGAGREGIQEIKGTTLETKHTTTFGAKYFHPQEKQGALCIPDCGWT
jgi:hypothetical protein